MNTPTSPLYSKEHVDQEIEDYEWEDDLDELKAWRQRAERAIDQAFEGPRTVLWNLPQQEVKLPSSEPGQS